MIDILIILAMWLVVVGGPLFIVERLRGGVIRRNQAAWNALVIDDKRRRLQAKLARLDKKERS